MCAIILFCCHYSTKLIFLEISHYSFICVSSKQQSFLTKVGLPLPSTRSYVLSNSLFESNSPKGTSTFPRSLKRGKKKKKRKQNVSELLHVIQFCANGIH